MILFEKLKQNFCKNFVGKTNIIMETDRESRKCATIAHLTMSLMCFLRQLPWTPCSADSIKIRQDVLKSESLIWKASVHFYAFNNSPLAHLPKYTLFAPQNFAEALFSASLRTNTKEKIPTRNEKLKGAGGKQGVSWERCKWGIARLDQQPCSHGFFRHFLTEKLWRRVCLKTVAYGTFQSSQTCQEDVESFVQMPR